MYIEQAYKGDNASWRVMLTLLVSTGFLIANSIFVMFLSKEEMDKVYELMKKIPSNIGLMANLVPFLVLFGLLIIMVIFVHKRSFLSLTTSRKKIDFSRIFFSACLIMAITIILFAVSYYLAPEEVVWNFKPVNFIILVMISLMLFPFQIGFEEYLFRGYLMQQLGVFAKNRWFPLMVTSVLFGLMHFANPEVAEMGYITMIFYIGFGLLMGIMTLMDEGLELALGFHFGNNFLAALLVSSEWSALQTDALFKYTAQNASEGVVTELIFTVGITFPIVLFICAKKYGWKNWKERLTGKVQPEELLLAENKESIDIL